jgi:uncharacterized membrane protein YbhN (UPF0104 family)
MLSGVWESIAAGLKLVVHARIEFIIAALVIELAGLSAMSFRWRLLLVKFGARPGFWNTLLAYSAGVFICNVTPARTIGGDATRGALIRSRADVPVKLVTASVVYDRATDAVGILALAALAFPTLRRSSSAPIVAGILAAVLLAFGVPFIRHAIFRRLAKWHSTLVGVEEMGGVAAAVAGCSVLVWFLDVCRIMVIARAFGVSLSPSEAATLTLIRLTSTIVPIPAGLGVADGALAAGLLWLGVPGQTTAAFVIVERAILYGWSTLLGLISWLVLGGSRLLTATQTT